MYYSITKKEEKEIDKQVQELIMKGMPKEKAEEMRARYEDDTRHHRIYELGTKAYDKEIKNEKKKKS